MEFDLVCSKALWDAAYISNIKGKITIKRFLWHCGAKRTSEKKINQKWFTEVRITDRNKWLLAKIKYGI